MKEQNPFSRWVREAPVGFQLCLSLSAHQTWPGWGDSSDSQLLPCLPGIPSASRQGELPKTSLGKFGWNKVAPSPQDPSPFGLLGSGVRPVVDWEETWMLNIIIFIYLLIPPENSLGSQQVIPNALGTCLVLEWDPRNLKLCCRQCIPWKIPLNEGSVFPFCPGDVL